VAVVRTFFGHSHIPQRWAARSSMPSIRSTSHPI
jgi:hypothetical protein